jgi:WD40 repeat protein
MIKELISFMFSLLLIICDCFADNTKSLTLIQKIPLHGVYGRIDHLAADIPGQRLFVAARGNGSLEIINLRTGRLSRSISGLSKPQGVLFIPETNKLYVTGGGDGKCSFFDGNSLKRASVIKFSGDADNIRYNPDTGCIYVGCCTGAIGVIDSANGAMSGSIVLKFHPEAFEIERGTGKIYVNIPDSGMIVVIDAAKKRIEDVWEVKEARDNFPMALHEQDHRLFVGCRTPPKLLIFDTVSGKLIAQLPIDDDADDIFYDARKNRIYISCENGYLDVVRQYDPYNYRLLEKIPTKPGARTSLFVPELMRLYLAVPSGKNYPAEIDVYETKN